MDPHLALDRPSDWVSRFAPLIPAGEVLDLACGNGRHVRLLTALGKQVLAVDRNADALAQAAGSGVATLQVDLEHEADGGSWPFAAARFAGIVVTNYLFRPLLPALAASLRPGGVLIYETFAIGNARFGKPSNPDFLLRPGELLALAHEHALHVVAYEHGQVEQPKPAMLQRIVAARAPANDSAQDCPTQATYPLQSNINQSPFYSS